MTKFEELVSSATLPVAVVCNSQTREYYMLDFPLPENMDAALDRGFVFVGVLGLVDGAAKTALAVELDAKTIEALSGEYAKRILAALAPVSPPAPNDGEEWLSRLYKLPDARA